MTVKLLHQIWLGSEIPKKFMEHMADWSLLNEGWSYNLWTQPLPDMINRDLYDSAHAYVKPDAVWQFRADLLRYEILYRYGGFYADTDTKPLRPLGDLFDHSYEWAVAEDDRWISNTYLYSVPGNPLFRNLIDNVRTHLQSDIARPAAATVASGPQYLTPLWEHYGGYVNYDTNLWLPYGWRQVDDWSFNRVEIPEDAYSIHMWAHRHDKRKAANRRTMADKRSGRI